MAIKNWTGSCVDYPAEVAEPISSQAMDAKYKVRKYACSTCPMGCGAIYEVPMEDGTKLETARPEYETMGTFGAMVMCNDDMMLIKCNDLCNEYGIDTISIGSTVAWAMDCYNEGILTKEELDGIDLTWGNADAVMQLTQKILDGEGCGKILQLGSYHAAKTYNKGFDQLVVAGGIELPMHDARYGPELARTYRFDPTPGRHVKGGYGTTYGALPPEKKYDYNYEGIGEGDMATTINMEIVNSAGYCQFVVFSRLSYEGKIKALEAITGFKYTQEEGINLGLRMYIQRLAFNLREGFQYKDFTISKRAVESSPPDDGPLVGVKVDTDTLGKHFFKAMGLNEQGFPTRELIDKVGGLEHLVPDLF
jgi:aldehyde:ferredoxin oxidoreductase